MNAATSLKLYHAMRYQFCFWFFFLSLAIMSQYDLGASPIRVGRSEQEDAANVPLLMALFGMTVVLAHDMQWLLLNSYRVVSFTCSDRCQSIPWSSLNACRWVSVRWHSALLSRQSSRQSYHKYCSIPASIGWVSWYLVSMYERN